MPLQKQLKQRVVRTIPGERFTPFSLANKLEAKALLESASFLRGKERYSILLLEEAFSVQQKNDEVFMLIERKKHILKSKHKDILDTLLYFANQHADFSPEFPFPAGGIGYLAYECAAWFDTIHLQQQKADPLNIPDAIFLFGHIFLIFDHYTDKIILIGLNYKEHEIDLEKKLDETEARINDMNFNFMNAQTEPFKAKIISNEEGEKEYYKKGVDQVKSEIIKGNLLQGVLSRRIYLETEIPALDAYKNLRSFNPSPYMFFLNFGDFQLFGSSPEVHVKVIGNKAIVRPIAGTRRRGKDEKEDETLSKDLLSDEKELAEHLMLVDLARNDLGRICKPGSVTVTEKMVIEKYSHVIHVVSQVEGELMNDKKGIDAIRATFPAGTVSGAPKIKAMEILDTLEREKRSFYAGIVGYLKPGNSLDTCITIRSAYKKDKLLVLQAGAGIVYDSVPENEYQETGNKLRALGQAIGVEV